MVGRLFKGSLIRARKNGAEFGKMYRAIMRKYGEIDGEADYYNRGNNDWTKYSPSRDAKFKAGNYGKEFGMSNANKGDSRYDKGKDGYV